MIQHQSDWKLKEEKQLIVKSDAGNEEHNNKMHVSFESRCNLENVSALSTCSLLTQITDKGIINKDMSVARQTKIIADVLSWRGQR